MKRDTRHVKGIIDGLIRKWEEGPVKKGSAVRDAWLSSAGEETAKHTRPVSLKNGILMVIVDNSVWLYKLTLEKKDLMEKFNDNYTGRKKAENIRFRVGAIDI